MATYTQRGQKWQAHIRLRDPRSGTLHKISKMFDRKKQDPKNPDAPYAEGWADDIESQIRNSRYHPENQTTLLQIIKHTNGKTKSLPSTLDDLINCWRAFKTDHLCVLNFDQVL